jgi:hypothetical protein
MTSGRELHDRGGLDALASQQPRDLYDLARLATKCLSYCHRARLQKRSPWGADQIFEDDGYLGAL